MTVRHIVTLRFKMYRLDPNLGSKRARHQSDQCSVSISQHACSHTDAIARVVCCDSVKLLHSCNVGGISCLLDEGRTAYSIFQLYAIRKANAVFCYVLRDIKY